MISAKELDAYNDWTDNHKEHLRYDYDLNANSICFDLGAFHCDWSIEISKRYNNPTIYAYEIMPDIFNVAKKRIIDYPNIKLSNLGLSNKSGEEFISDNGESTSFFISGNHKTKVFVKSIKHIIENLNISHIDIMKLNVEGAEYDILECLIANNMHTMIDNLQIQFHKTVPDYESKYEYIRQQLQKTHKTTYDFYFVWENWAKI